MGCDIHIVLEQQTARAWVGIDTFKMHTSLHRKDGDFPHSLPVARSRNYSRFAKLAGVRGDGPEPRGIPDDASDTSRLLIGEWGQDGHSHSWLEVDEAARIFLATEYREVPADDFQAKFPLSYYFNLEGVEAKEDQYRIVFWFDS